MSSTREAAEVHRRWRVAAAALAAVVLAPFSALAQVSADIAAGVAGGYARLVLTFGEAVSPKVKVANGIIVVTVDKPLGLTAQRIERLPGELGDYVPMVRLDPDLRGLRLALGRKVTVNTMEAGEKLFIDLLPDGWTGMPPGLPQEVVADLARRALEAERRVRQLGSNPAAAGRVVRLRLGQAPTFSRFSFSVPEGIEVDTKRDEDGVTVAFVGPVAIDLGDARTRLPATVRNLTSELVDGGGRVRLGIDPDVGLRTFREGDAYVLDLTPPKSQQSKPGPPSPLAGAAMPAVAPLPPERPKGAAEPAAPAPQPAAMPQPKPPMPPPEVAVAVKPELPPPAVVVPPPSAPPAAAAAAPPPATEAPRAVAPEQPPAAPPTAAAAPPAAPPAAAAAPSRTLPRIPVADPPAALVVAPEPATPAAAPRPGSVFAHLTRHGGALKIKFAFPEPTAAAVFRRGEALWMVFDTDRPLDLTGLARDETGTFRDIQATPSAGGIAVRMRLSRPWLVGAEAEGLAWTITFGDVVLEPTQPLIPTRAMADGRAILTVPLEAPRKLHRLADADAGDTILAVTAPGPPRGLARTQDYVEFSLLASTHGVAVVPVADDIAIEPGSDKVIVSRPIGLVLSPPGLPGGKRSGGAKPVGLDPQVWGFDRAAPFRSRLSELMETASTATDRTRQAARLDVARFYLANGLAPEARGVLDVVIGDAQSSDDPTPYLLRALAWLDLARPVDALKDLSHPLLASSLDAAVLRGLVHAGEGRWREARENFLAASGVVGSLPIEVQRRAVAASVRAAIEVQDFPGAARSFSDFETVGIPPEMESEVAVLSGRLAEGTGQIDDALTAYKQAMRAVDTPAGNEAKLRDIALRLRSGRIDAPAAIYELEGLYVTWRGDRTEAETMHMLGRLYVEGGRYRDGFRLLEAAQQAHPNSDITRDLYKTMSETFAELFLERTGDAMPPLEALGIFYDYSNLIPIGRRGDEMIRRLADRLVSVDLLEQAAELLQHQVEQRLTGAARAQVAARLAMVHLKNRKPDLALKALRQTRLPELPNDVREQRQLLEARAYSDTGRHDLALEIIDALQGREAERLRADIQWAAKRWRAAAEAIERAYGDRWKTFAPLADHERHDVLRGAVGYALAEDRIGLERFRSRYAGKMADSPDRAAFEAVTVSLGVDRADFREVAKALSAVDSLEQFLRDYRARFSGSEGKLPEAPAAPPAAPPATPPAPPARS